MPVLPGRDAGRALRTADGRPGQSPVRAAGPGAPATGFGTGTTERPAEGEKGGGPMTTLDGTLPVCPFHPDGFVGRLEADGQQVRVAALACDTEQVIALSLVGFDTSIGVVLARLWSLTSVPFAPATAWQTEWSGPERLKRSSERYKQCVAHLEGTREVHALALLRTAHLTEGILHPPDLPEMREQPSAVTAEQEQAVAPSPTQAKPPLWIQRYILGNWDECLAARR